MLFMVPYLRPSVFICGRKTNWFDYDNDDDGELRDSQKFACASGDARTTEFLQSGTTEEKRKYKSIIIFPSVSPVPLWENLLQWFIYISPLRAPVREKT